uniref:Spermatogenesis-associated protein 2 PUB-like domain-containing protein n=1 Tax=Monopterus albus TaxID=43700 RepID=A0A3Q3J797_MONAL|nr:spermatogenesis-associated protein 2-like protein [Monopterus albus]XP_020468408.1 spermatogenesis-associated protein 2-like protein [Monopterus albus]XP_020468409.1 spermatogenesis-associated protein 2-like protein [Monopterus albus]XP_020468410.1 spermatogenesis-associated protein 2-like protein [Monopterus albus]XP_020468411.1 spermatogenesis-associated protein 2-like protein [Monopterus albus]
MNTFKQRARGLVVAYDDSLEQQIVGQGSSMACRDDELWKQVEGLLKAGDAQEMHCLALDPLKVMEESLVAAAVTAPGGGQVKGRGGLRGLAKAFEVLEQAALNLYLGPWREEYKAVKMYSGVFTHSIKPVLSMPQVEKLFGLLGYQPSSDRPEQLRLQSPRIKPGALNNLLCLSCAFFLARCECHLLLTALGRHAGETQWELSVVRERQRGNNLQVALDNTEKLLVNLYDGEADMDLYTDEQVNGSQSEAVVSDDATPHSVSWMTQSSASPQAARTYNSGVSSMSLHTSEHACISTLSCQLISPLESDADRSSSAGKRQGRRACEESRIDTADLQSQLDVAGLIKREAKHLCICHRSPDPYLQHCVDCRAFHNITCALLKGCLAGGHHVLNPDRKREEIEESGSVSSQSKSLRVTDMRAPPTLTGSSAAVSSSLLCDDPESIITAVHPITYHDCCNLNRLDPQVLCVSCGVFHSHSCPGMRDFCQTQHTIKQLGLCICGKRCTRKPLVLCRYCGNEYCINCWYRSPVVCSCGQTFDQSSPV